MSETEWLETFANNLSDIMVEVRITQEELAEEAGLSKSTVNRYLNKQRMPTIKAVVNMAIVLDCDLNDFLDFGSFIE